MMHVDADGQWFEEPAARSSAAPGPAAAEAYEQALPSDQYIRRTLHRRGYHVAKSKQRDRHAANYGKWFVVRRSDGAQLDAMDKATLVAFVRDPDALTRACDIALRDQEE